MRNISPSVLSADFTNIEKDIRKVERTGATRLHLDVMDGHFVPNLTFGPLIVDSIRRLTDLHLETHLMISNPDKYLVQFIEAGSDTVIFHLEASTDIERDINIIKSNDVLAGIAINPDTKVEKIIPYLDDIDYVLVMSVFPGFGGQSFIEDTLLTMEQLVEIRNGRKYLVGVDGGINTNIIRKVYETGIDITIVGSNLFGANDFQSRYIELMNE